MMQCVHSKHQASHDTGWSCFLAPARSNKSFEVRKEYIGLVLGTVNEETLLEGLESLLASLASRLAKDQLTLETPHLWDVPGCCDLLVDQRVVVLQVGAETFCLESCPDCNKVSRERPNNLKDNTY